jgi:hypothetical protein
LNWRPGEPENRSRLSGENSLVLPGIEIRFLGRPSQNKFLSLLDGVWKVIEAWQFYVILDMAFVHMIETEKKTWEYPSYA